MMRRKRQLGEEEDGEEKIDERERERMRTRR